MEQQDERTLRFGEFALTATPLRLTRNGRPVRLRMQALRLLALLAARPGQLLLHREIREALWKEQVVDFKGGVHVCIRQIRGALGDSLDPPRFVETVPRQGYRFVAPVHRDSRDDNPPGPPAPAAAPRIEHLRLFGGGVAIAALAVIALIVARQPAGLTESPTARDAYLRGKYLLEQGTPDQVAKGMAFLRDAVAADSNYADAHVGLAEAYSQLGDPALAKRHAAQALALAPGSAEAHVQYAIALMENDRNWKDADRHLAAALAIAPRSARALHVAASRSAIVGDLKRAIRQMDAAVRIDPASTLLQADFGWLLYLAGRPADAVRRCREALQLDPRHVASLLCIERAAESIGDFDAAGEAATRLMKLWNASSNDLTAIAGMPPAQEVRHFHRWRLRFFSTYPDPSAITPVDMADAYAAVGDYSNALSQLELAADSGSRSLPFVLADPILGPVQEDARYRRLRARLNLAGSPSIR